MDEDNAAESLLTRLRRFAAETQGRSEQSTQFLAAMHYRSRRASFMLDVLDLARRGKLEPNWRDTIASSQRHQSPHMYSDGEELALHEMRNLDPVPWEPGAGVGWRAALEAWYVAICDAYDQTDRLHADGSAQTCESLSHSQNMRKLLGAGDAAGEQRVAALIQRIQESERGRILGMRLQRAYLEAWYRAGLAAGGDESDWIGWFRTQIEEADDPQMRQAWLTRLDDPTTRPEMESLPDYWTHG